MSNFSGTRKLGVLFFCAAMAIGCGSAGDEAGDWGLEKADDTDDIVALSDAAANGMRAYGDLIKARGTYLTSLGQARLSFAKAAYAEALARAQYEKVRQLALYIDQMERDFRRLNREIYDQRRLISKIESRARTLSVMKRGVTNVRVWNALNYFLQDIVPYDQFEVAVTIPVPDSAKSADNFVPNDDDGRAQSFDGSDAGELLAFLEEHDFSVKKFGGAHRIVMKAIHTMVVPAQTRVSELKAEIQAIRAAEYDIWNTPNPDANYFGPLPPNL